MMLREPRYPHQRDDRQNRSSIGMLGMLRCKAHVGFGSKKGEICQPPLNGR
jgi:hypothetical protein